MKLLFMAMILTFVSFAKAETIECSFTEPFRGLKYSTETRNFVLRDDESHRPVADLKNVSLVRESGNKYAFKTSDGKVIARLELTNEGSDGMSEIIYPFDIRLEGPLGFQVGGCESSQLKRHH